MSIEFNKKQKESTGCNQLFDLSIVKLFSHSIHEDDIQGRKKASDQRNCCFFKLLFSLGIRFNENDIVKLFVNNVCTNC